MQHHGRSIGVLFDFTTGMRDGLVAWGKGIQLEEILIEGGAGDSNPSEGDVVVRVGAENEEEARKNVSELKSKELREKVRVEVVETTSMRGSWKEGT